MVYGLDIGFTILGIQYSGNWQLYYLFIWMNYVIPGKLSNSQNIHWLVSADSSRQLRYQPTGHCWPIRGQYPGHMITIDQSEASIQVTWSLSAN